MDVSKKALQHNFDLVIEEVNSVSTVGFTLKKKHFGGVGK